MHVPSLLRTFVIHSRNHAGKKDENDQDIFLNLHHELSLPPRIVVYVNLFDRMTTESNRGSVAEGRVNHEAFQRREDRQVQVTKSEQS